jgi:molybdate transport system ATP-binding protein
MTESRNYAAASHHFPVSGFSLDLALELAPGWNVLFGPSGAGKSTFLRAVAGLLRPQRGIIRIGDEVWLDIANDIFLPPERRSIGFVAQRPVLFPHLSVAQNVVFGVALSPRNTAELAAEMLEIFHSSHLVDRRVTGLSGGEQQRVALARAVARQPKILLLDEPFRGLDFDLRDAILADLQTWLDRSHIPVLAASHDVAEICQVQAYVTRVGAGKMAGSGPAATLLAAERQQILQRLGV